MSVTVAVRGRLWGQCHCHRQAVCSCSPGPGCGPTDPSGCYWSPCPLRVGLKGSALPRAPSQDQPEGMERGCTGSCRCWQPSVLMAPSSGSALGGREPLEGPAASLRGCVPLLSPLLWGSCSWGCLWEMLPAKLPPAVPVVPVLHESLILNYGTVDTPARQLWSLFSWLCLKSS